MDLDLSELKDQYLSLRVVVHSVPQTWLLAHFEELFDVF